MLQIYVPQACRKYYFKHPLQCVTMNVDQPRYKQNNVSSIRKRHGHRIQKVIHLKRIRIISTFLTESKDQISISIIRGLRNLNNLSIIPSSHHSEKRCYLRKGTITPLLCFFSLEKLPTRWYEHLPRQKTN